MDYRYLYDLTCHVTPLEEDCGLLCKSICCRRDRKNSLGIYLFPGEEIMLPASENWIERELHDPGQYEFPDNWKDPVHFIKCTSPCPREKRPLACRFFPLAPHLLSDGTLLLTYESVPLPYRCPLIHRRIPLRKDFVEVVGRAWQLLLEDPRILRLVEEDSREREKIMSGIPPILWSGSP